MTIYAIKNFILQDSFPKKTSRYSTKYLIFVVRNVVLILHYWTFSPNIYSHDTNKTMCRLISSTSNHLFYFTIEFVDKSKS